MGLKATSAVVLAMGMTMAIAGAVDVQAVSMTGEHLNDNCQDFLRLRKNQEYDPGKAFMCLGFIQGVADELEAEKLVCTPAVTVATIADIVAQYLDNHPEQRQYWGRIVVLQALRAAYPCQK
jgi:hypothetical protein